MYHSNRSRCDHMVYASLSTSLLRRLITEDAPQTTQHADAHAQEKLDLDHSEG